MNDKDYREFPFGEDLGPCPLNALPGGIPLTHPIQSSEPSLRTFSASVLWELGYGGHQGCLGPSPQSSWSNWGRWQFECSVTGAGMGVLWGPEGVVPELVWNDEQE